MDRLGVMGMCDIGMIVRVLVQLMQATLHTKSGWNAARGPSNTSLREHWYSQLEESSMWQHREATTVSRSLRDSMDDGSCHTELTNEQGWWGSF